MRVLLFGTFDRLHEGHRFVLREALARGDVFVVVARDANVWRIKNKHPKQPEEMRKQAIEAEFPKITVMLGDREDFLKPIRDIKPDMILLGYDQALPPGIEEKDLGVLIERLTAFHPETFKTSLMD